MKHLMKVSLMALVAMFAFNTTADAQLGGLLKKAKAAVSGKSSQNNAGQAIYDQMKAREAAEAAKMEEIQKQAVISPYNASVHDMRSALKYFRSFIHSSISPRPQ